MKFNLSTAGCIYNLEQVEKLEKLGFEFTKEPEYDYFYLRYQEIKPTIEINSIEDLLDFQKNYGDFAITDNTLIIWDDYL